ncbi:MAG: hypothetical protein JW709_02880 [Sedimentisphaerales bacterium]|nr:hypothetical protein [Sedimentisphaerales bacterium]
MSQHAKYHKSTTVESARICWASGMIFSMERSRRVMGWLCGLMAVVLCTGIVKAQENVGPEPPATDSPATEQQEAPVEEPAASVDQDRIAEIVEELAAETGKENPDKAKIEALQKELDSLLEKQVLAEAELPEEPVVSKEQAALENRLFALMAEWGEESAKDPESEKTKALTKEIEEISKQIEALVMAEASKETPEVVTPPVKEEPVRSAPSRTPPFSGPQAPPPPSPGVQPVEPETKEPATEPKETEKSEKPEIKTAAPPGPDDVIKLTLRDNMIDINYLLELIGKEMGFIFLYDAIPPATNVRIQQYGDLHRRDLLPLLESLLRFNGFSMVREDPFIRIVQIGQAVKTTEIKIDYGGEEKSLEPGDMVVVQIFELQHVPLSQIQNILANFTTAQGVILPVPTNPNMMIITEYARRMPRLLELIDLLDQPGPPRRLEVTEVTYIVAADAATQLQNLIRDLGEYTATVSKAPVPSRRQIGRPTTRTGPRPPTPQPQPEQAQVTPEAAGPVIHVDERTNRLFIIGTDEQIEQTKQLLTLLDVKVKDPVLIRAFVMKEVMPSDIGQQIISLLEAIGEDEEDQVIPTSEEKPLPQPQRTPRPVGRNRTTQTQRSLMQAGEGGPFLLGDDRTNRLIVVGKESQIEKIQELLELLDVPAAMITGAHIVVYTLKNVEAAEAEDILNALEVTRSTERPNARERARGIGRPGQPTTGSVSGQVMTGEVQGLPTEEDFEVKTAIQESTNRLFVLATNKQHEQIANIIEKVDMEPPDDMGAIQVYFLENRDPEEVASMLESLLESEQRDDKGQVNVPGKEGAPIVVSLPEIYAVAVRASAKQHDNIRRLVEILDKRLPQVLVEAILVQVNADDALDLGVSLQNAYDTKAARSSTRMISGLSPFGVAGSTLSVPGATGVVGGSGATLAFYTDDLVYASVEALETDGKGKVVSMPRILVNDNEEGKIDSKREEPTTKTTVPAGSDTPIIEFAGYEDAGTTLTITPHISEGDFLKLEITLSVNSFLGESSGSVPPPKSTNEISTMVTVPNNTTIVLGGLTTETTGTTVNKIPLLGDIPFAGALFRNVSYSQNKNVLYVFVKANIIRSDKGGETSFEDLDILSEKHREKLRKLEKGYENLPIIPGIPADKKEDRSVLDEDY